METITLTGLTLYTDRGSKSSTPTFYTEDHWYINNERITYAEKYEDNTYYKIAINTDENKEIKSFTINTGMWVSGSGNSYTATIVARLYTNEADAQQYNNNYTSEVKLTSTEVKATTRKKTFTFTNLNLSNCTALYVTFKRDGDKPSG
jgi:hypothetical protein